MSTAVGVNRYLGPKLCEIYDGKEIPLAYEAKGVLGSAEFEGGGVQEHIDEPRIMYKSCFARTL